MSALTAVAFGLLAMVATLSGGAVALRLQSKLSVLFGFSSGVVLGVALFDLMPEALALAGNAQLPMAIMTDTACGFLGYLTLNRLTLSLQRHGLTRLGTIAPAALTLHSAMDGLAFGLAFVVSPGAGILVGTAVLAHDFVDGANTVVLSLAAGGARPAARRWLIVNALSPSIGLLAARLFAVPQQVLASLLAIFAGGFLYIGASELLPRSRQAEASIVRVLAVVLGFGFTYLVARLGGA